MSMLDKVKTALRMKTDVYDTEITDLINAAKDDLQITDIYLEDLEDDGENTPLIIRAIILYCKMYFGFVEDGEFSRLKKAYDELKAQLSMNSEYTRWEGEDAGGKMVVDDYLSTTSKNPVQNRVITNALNATNNNVSSNTQAISNLNVQLGALSASVSGHTNSINALENQQHEINAQLENISNDLARVDEDIANITDELSDKQDKLSLGQGLKWLSKNLMAADLKTINGESLLGEGDIDTNNVFIAIKNVTPYAEIAEACDANKVIYYKTGQSAAKHYVCTYTKYFDESTQRDQIQLFSMRARDDMLQALIYSDEEWVERNFRIQERLVNGTNIKSINGNSLLGSGDIPISQVPNGGTAGMLLAKQSDADGDVGWVGPTTYAFSFNNERTEMAGRVRNSGQFLDITFASPHIDPDTMIIEGRSGIVAHSQKILPTIEYAPHYELCDNDVGGNVQRINKITINGEDYGVYQFYYKTNGLPNTTAKAYSLTNILAEYTIQNFIDATGITSNGIFISNGRTDNNNRVIVQQFSKNNKTITLRAYQDFSNETATLKIQFIGKYNG